MTVRCHGRPSRRRGHGQPPLCNSLHRCATLPAWPSSTRCWSRCASARRRGSSWRGASSGRSASSGTPRTSRSTGCWPGWRATAGSTVETVAAGGPPRPRRSTPSPPLGAQVLADWLAEPAADGAAAQRARGQDARRVVRRPRGRARRRARRPWPTTQTRLAHYRAADAARLPRAAPPWPASTSTTTSCCAAASAWRRPGSTGSPNTWRPTHDDVTPTRTCSPRSRSAT